MENAYYYSQLNKQQQAAYYAMLEGLKSLSSSFVVPRLEGKELFDIHFLLRLDHPELFYSEAIKYRYYDNSTSVEVVPTYLFDKKKVKSHRQAMETRVDKLARPALKYSEEDKIQYIHDFICQNIHYDKLKKQYSHEIIGPLGQGVGVCEGIAKSVKVLADALNLWCIIAISEANPEKGIKYRHAWNVLRIQGKYYHFDATFDNSLGKDNEIRYDYYLLSDKQIFRDHEPVIWAVPLCSDSDLFYYKKKKLSFTKLEDVKNRSAQAVRKKKALTFHWRGGYLTREILAQILQMIESAATTKEKHAIVSVNVPQAVIYVTFSDAIPQEQLILEDADEGNAE